MTTIIDRRLNPKDKNLVNRQRFIQRAKESIRGSVKNGIQNRSVSNTDGSEKVNIPVKDIQEEFFRRSHKHGVRDHVLPGNKEFVPGDTIRKPDGGGGSGKQGAQDGSGEDDFQFTLTKDEFMDIFFEDLDLPDMVKENLKETKVYTMRHAGFTTSGNPANLSVEQTMRKALGRKIALHRPKGSYLEELEANLAQMESSDPRDEDAITALTTLIVGIKKKMRAVSYIDPIDLRYRARVKDPVPKSQAVMFCLMDVSGSMGEREKDLSKRFFMLLYMFLTRKYETIDVVFVRHHTEAYECTEEDFFYAKDTGGTVVSKGLDLICNIIKDRYSPNDWNIYVSQCSDGDNWSNDSPVCEEILERKLLSLVQYFCYIEIQAEQHGFSHLRMKDDDDTLWNTYSRVTKHWNRLQIRAVTKPGDIFPVFHELFEKKASA